jgi:hypothetical protein
MNTDRKHRNFAVDALAFPLEYTTRVDVCHRTIHDIGHLQIVDHGLGTCKRCRRSQLHVARLNCGDVVCIDMNDCLSHPGSTSQPDIQPLLTDDEIAALLEDPDVDGLAVLIHLQHVRHSRTESKVGILS